MTTTININDYVFVHDALGDLVGKVEKINPDCDARGESLTKYGIRIQRNDKLAWFSRSDFHIANLNNAPKSAGFGKLTDINALNARHSRQEDRPSLLDVINMVRKELRKTDEHRGWQLKYIGSICTLTCSHDHNPTFASVVDAVKIVEGNLNLKGTRACFSYNETYSVIVNWAW